MSIMQRYTPPDYLRGSKNVGGTYTAWDTYGQGTPDFGHQKGPGDPYHEVQKKVKPVPNWTKPKGIQLPWAPGIPIGGNSGPWSNNIPRGDSGGDPRIEAIRRRLRGL